MRLRCNCDERVATEREYWQGIVTDLIDRITLLKVDPPMAAIQAVAEEQVGPAHITITDDEAIADYEQERRTLAASTRDFIAQYQPEAAAS